MVPFSSPNYPDFYPPGSNCTWLIDTGDHRKAILRFTDFKLGKRHCEKGRTICTPTWQSISCISSLGWLQRNWSCCWVYWATVVSLLCCLPIQHQGISLLSSLQTNKVKWYYSPWSEMKHGAEENKMLPAWGQSFITVCRDIAVWLGTVILK